MNNGTYNQHIHISFVLKTITFAPITQFKTDFALHCGIHKNYSKNTKHCNQKHEKKSFIISLDCLLIFWSLHTEAG